MKGIKSHIQHALTCILYCAVYSSNPSIKRGEGQPGQNKSFEMTLYRRRINTEERAKVVAAVWGTELIQFLARLDILYKYKLMMNSSFL